MVAHAGEIAVVGGAFLRAMGFTDDTVHVEHDRRLQVARVHTINPCAGQIGQCSEVRVTGQPSRLEAAHLARRGGTTIQPAAVHYGANGRIMRQAISVVRILIAGQSTGHRPTKQPSQQVAGVLATAALRQHCTCEISEAERVIQFSMDQDAGIGSGAAAVEYQLQAAVEIDPQNAINRFARWVFHAPTTMINATC